ncbi:hypothetical protein [Thermocatellispora tengchongensis]|uniref:hypothetical protein n=1 Tax=Thermocatellispora tengchongensis TaxID=1073253 RepID=UPI00336D5171
MYTPSTASPAGTPLPLPAQTASQGWQYAYLGDSGEPEMLDIVAPARDDAWAVGRRGDALTLLRYDGTEWRAQEPPPGVSLGDGRAVLGASGPRDVWLIGGSGAVRWDGTAWRPAPAPGATAVTDLAALGPRDAWAVTGEDTAWHWDGSRWEGVRLPAKARGVSGTGPGDVWAVGWRDSGPGVAGEHLTQPAAMHWDGRSWRLVETPLFQFADPVPPEASATLSEVVAVAPGEAWALGEQTFNHGETENEPADPPPLLLHWDGAKWHRGSAPRSSYCCPRIASAGAGRVLIVVNGPRMRDSWLRDPSGATTPLPALPGMPGRPFVTVHALATEPGTGTVWAAGSVELNRGAAHHALVARYP